MKAPAYAPLPTAPASTTRVLSEVEGAGSGAYTGIFRRSKPYESRKTSPGNRRFPSDRDFVSSTDDPRAAGTNVRQPARRGTRSEEGAQIRRSDLSGRRLRQYE